MERSDIIAACITFLCKMNEFRTNCDTRPIVYLDENWVNQNHTRRCIWQYQENTEGLKLSTGKAVALLFVTPVLLPLVLSKTQN